MAAKVVSISREDVAKRMLEVAHAMAEAGLEPDLTTVAAMIMLVENLKTSHGVLEAQPLRDSVNTFMAPMSKRSH